MQQVESIIQTIVAQIASVTRRAPADIDVDQPFIEMGIESLQAVNIVSAVNARLGIDLAPTVMFDHPTVRKLAEAIANPAPAVASASGTIAGTAKPKSSDPSEPIAIVGMSCRLPGAHSIDEFWRNLHSETDCISEVPRDRWPLEDYYSEDPNRPGKMVTKWGGFIEDVDKFDNDALGISDPEAAKMDPQQRLLLETAWEAMEDAGYSPQELGDTRTGVFIGISSSDYSVLSAQAHHPVDVYDATGNAHSIAANRISYLFNFRGPSLSIDTACSSSLTAVHLACQSLRRRETDAVLAGGVNVLLTPDLSVAFSQAQMLSPEGRCKTFSDQPDGYVRGEGAGVLLLKRLSDAVRDGDPIHALIRGTAVNQDGRSSGLTAPNGPAQEAVVRDALQDAGLETEDIQYVEAHGTGTPLGDPIEYLSLSRVFGTRVPGEELVVGSVKTNIGHLEGAAGVAGLMKTVLALKNRWIPRSLHFHSINPKIGDRAPNLRVASEGQPWLTPFEFRRAGVSSFGFGGTNAHVILEEYMAPDVDLLQVPSVNGPRLLLGLSASGETALQEMAAALRDRLSDADENGARTIAAACLKRRMSLPHRLLIHGADRAELIANLEAFLRGEKKTGWAAGRSVRRGTPKVAFLFTGQGSQSPGMGLELYDQFPTYREAFDDCCEIVDHYFEWDLLSVVRSALPATEAALYQTDYGQVALFALEYSLAQLLKHDFGLEPACVFGHSLGELVAATVAGAMSLADGLQLVANRGRLMQSTGEGGMLAVYASAEETEALLRVSGLALEIAAINGPSLTVLSGPVEAADRFESVAKQSSIRCARLKVQKAFHSRLMEPVLERFERAAEKMTYSAPHIPIVSSLHGQWITPEEDYSSSYWRRQLRQPTQFLKAMQTLEQSGCTAYLEIGPHPTLVQMGQSCLPKTNAKWFTLQQRKSPQVESLYQGLCEIAASGIALRFKIQASRKVQIPLTRFQKKRHWAFAIKASVQPNAMLSPQTSQTPLTPTSPHVPASQPQIEVKMSETRANEVLEDLRSLVGRLLQMDPAEFNVDEPLIDLGADSLLLLNAIQTIKDRYQVSIAISEVFKDLSTLRLIANYVAANESSPTAAAMLSAPQSMMPASPLPTQIPPLTLPLNVGSMNSGAGVPGDLRAIIDQQIRLMNMQLQMLQGGAVTVPTGVPMMGAMPSSVGSSVPHSTSGSSTPAPQKEKRGVLGNFSARANLEVTKPDDDKKACYLQKLIENFAKKTAKTKEHTQKYRMALADNRVSAGFRPNTKEIVYPIICRKAKGSKFTDLDGNEYIDFTMGFGVNLFGHSPDFVETAIREQIEYGMCVGPQSHLAGEVAERFVRITGQERVAFCNSGTEAVMTAIRLARAVTKREKIVLFDGSYHGHFDGVLARAAESGQSIPVAPGVTRGFTGDVLVLEYGTPESLEIIRREANNLAAVLVEPVQSRFPELQPKEFLREVRAITEQSGTAFIWDEVICGFRMAPGGAQEYFGIKADLASYGKVLGGGMPIGAIAGRERFMNPIDGGFWRFGDDSYPDAEMTFFAGTFSKHPLAMAASDAILRKMENEGHQIIAELNRRTEALKNELNEYFASQELDLRVNNFGSLFRFKANTNLDLFFFNLNLRGMYVWEGRNLFLATAHTEQDVRRFIDCVKESTESLIEAGYFRKKATGTAPTRREFSQSAGPVWNLLAPQDRFQKLSSEGPDGEAASHICLAVKMKGDLKVELLEQAITLTCARYDAFRLRFNLAERTQWLVPAHGCRLERDSVRGVKGAWTELDRRLQTEGRKPFALDKDCPIRFLHYDVLDGTSILALVAHHIAFDGWSVALLIEDLANAYTVLSRGEQPTFEPVLAFGKFLSTPDRFGPPHRLEEARAHWEHEFPQVPSYVRWPKTRERRTAAHASLKGQRVVFDIEYSLYTNIKKTAQSLKASPLMFMLSAFTMLLGRIDGSGEFVIGTPAGNRDLDGADKMVGNCANLLPIHLKLIDGEAPQDLIKRVKSEMIKAYQNMIHPYEELEAKLGKPLFNVSFNVEPASELPDFGEVSLFIHPYPITASEYDLTMNITDLEFVYHGEIDFKTDLMSDDEVMSWVDQYIEILKDLVKSLADR